MSRLKVRFAALKARRRRALIPFFTAGDPDLATSLKLMHEAVAQGADLIELGVPFSDPSADGPVVQAASERALANGVRLCDVIDLVRQFRTSDEDTPVVLMGYLNPIEAMGYAEFASAATAAGVDAVIVVDLPVEEAPDLQQVLDAVDVDMVFLVAPTTTPKRMQAIVEHARGCLYYVSLKGVTGASHLDTSDVERRLAALRSLCDLPLVVGFGIRDAATAEAIGRCSDGVVVGSAIVQSVAELSQGASNLQVTQCLGPVMAPLRAALDHL
ncbi:MAG: tryptophan synthase subunit alpha [Pseudomonadota bacterium]|nr:tryptophan synthase subunit alpha [Pseudomonadota bacterium]